MASASTAFRVAYSDVEPTDVEWFTAPLGAKTEFKRLVVQLVLQEKDADLAQGLDRFGFQLARLSKFTRKHRKSAMGPADPNAPPLTPAYALSRTRSLLDGRAMTDYAEFFWRSGWGKILNYHRIGAPNHWAKSGFLPVRDVIGLSPAAINRVKRAVAIWWASWKRSRSNSTPLKPQSYPVPKRRPKAKPAPLPTPPGAAQPTAPLAGKALLNAGADFAARYGVSVQRKGAAVMQEAAQGLTGGGWPTRPEEQPLAMFLREKGDTIFINENHPFWKGNQAPQLAEQYGASGWFATTDPQALIYHEVGHALQSRGLDNRLYSTMLAADWRAGEVEIAAQVSRYAATRPSEFVAETFAGMQVGKTYSSEVMNLYRSFHGPSLEPPP